GPSRARRRHRGLSPRTRPCGHPEPADTCFDLGMTCNGQGKSGTAQPLYEKALEIYRRRLTDAHRLTANGYSGVAYNLGMQGKYYAAQPLLEKALAIRRRLLTDDHSETAISYGNLAHILNAQGNYAQAQPLYEKALEIHHRLLPH